jgi:hypothetical protein
MAKPISRKELIPRFRNLGFAGPISGSRHPFVQKANSRFAFQIRTKAGAD